MFKKTRSRTTRKSFLRLWRRVVFFWLFYRFPHLLFFYLCSALESRGSQISVLKKNPFSDVFWVIFFFSLSSSFFFLSPLSPSSSFFFFSPSLSHTFNSLTFSSLTFSLSYRDGRIGWPICPPHDFPSWVGLPFLSFGSLVSRGSAPSQRRLL